MVPGHIQASKAGKQLIVLDSPQIVLPIYDVYEPQQQTAWQENAKDTKVTHTPW